MRQLRESSQGLIYRVSQAEFDFYLGKFYAWFHEEFRRSQRGEAHYSAECRLMCLQILVSFWYMAGGNPPNSIGDWSKYEGPRTKLTLTQQNLLTEISVSTDEKIFREKLAQEILSVLTEICQREKCEFNEKKFRKVMELVDVKIA